MIVGEVNNRHPERGLSIGSVQQVKVPLNKVWNRHISNFSIGQL